MGHFPNATSSSKFATKRVVTTNRILNNKNFFWNIFLLPTLWADRTFQPMVHCILVTKQKDCFWLCDRLLCAVQWHNKQHDDLYYLIICNLPTNGIPNNGMFKNLPWSCYMIIIFWDNGMCRPIAYRTPVPKQLDFFSNDLSSSYPEIGWDLPNTLFTSNSVRKWYMLTTGVPNNGIFVWMLYLPFYLL